MPQGTLLVKYFKRKCHCKQYQNDNTKRDETRKRNKARATNKLKLKKNKEMKKGNKSVYLSLSMFIYSNTNIKKIDQ